ncbi:helix-turn-helix domain-containing protein [Rhizobium sp. GCM10022189]|uniref:helix-turn-helix domain-containing protein n=1 Tax=Rhizobium sp. GCM10022189 TaxID=3252654 RepID=UPI0036206440
MTEINGLLTSKQAADMLTISVKVLRAHVKAGDIAFISKGTGTKRPKMAFDPTDIQEFINRRRTRQCPSIKTPKVRSTSSTSSSTVVAFSALRRPVTKKKP